MSEYQGIADLLKQLDQYVIIQILLIFIATGGLITLAQRLLPIVADSIQGRYRPYVLASMPVLRLLLILGAVVLVIAVILTPNVDDFVTLLGVAGLALGFAFKDYVSSLIAGIIALYEMPYRPGDWIEVDGAYGEVRSIGLRAVEIVTPDDTVVVIPNLKLWDKLIFNANDGTQRLLCVANFYLHPRHNASRVKELLYDVALTSPFLQIQQPVTVIVLEKPWGTQYRLKAYPNDPREQFQFTTDLTVRGKAALMSLGAEFVTAPAFEQYQA